MTVFYFPQLENELLHVFWERIEAYIVQYAFHVEIWEMCDIIYDGVNWETRDMIGEMCGWRFDYLSYDEQWELLKYLAQNSAELETKRKADMEELKSMAQELLDGHLQICKTLANLNIDALTRINYAMSETTTSTRDDLDLFDDYDYDDEVGFSLETPSPVVEVDLSVVDNLEVRSLLDVTFETGYVLEPNCDPLESFPLEEDILREEEYNDQINDSWAAQVDAIEVALIGNGFSYVETQNMEDLSLSSYATEVIPPTLDISLQEDALDDHIFVFPVSLSLCISPVPKRVNLIPSSPLLYPTPCLSTPFFAHTSPEVVTVVSSHMLPLRFDTTRGRPPDQYELIFDNNVLLVVDMRGDTLIHVPPYLSYDATYFTNGWSCVVVFHTNCHVKFDKLKHSLSLILYAYILSCCYLSFSIAHAQVYDLLLRALCCFDLC